jgi:uncharacterized protein YbjT (DUF2867 family)
MATLTSVLVLGPTGGFGKFLIAELVNRRADFKRIGAFNDTERPPSAEKVSIFEDFAGQGVEVVAGTFSDVKAFSGKRSLPACMPEVSICSASNAHRF